MDAEIFFYGVIGSVPTFLVLFAGAAACAIYARRDPHACTLTGLAIVIDLGSRIGLPWVSTWIFTTFLQDLQGIHWRVMLNSFMYSIPNSLIWLLLLWAIFGRLIRDGGPQQAGLLDEGSDDAFET